MYYIVNIAFIEQLRHEVEQLIGKKGHDTSFKSPIQSDLFRNMEKWMDKQKLVQNNKERIQT